MFSDIVMPKNNEEEFIEIASKLGIKKLYFLYEPEDRNKPDLTNNKHNIEIRMGFIVTQKNISMAAQHSVLLAAKSSDSDRMLIEGKKIKIIYGLEELHKKDRLHQRASGLNHIICELARKNNVAVGFSYGSLFSKNPETAALIMGRMMQNIALCRKYGVKTITASFSQNPYCLRARHDIARLFAMMGMDEKNMAEP
ncbi:hypothetical protein HYT53_03220 [Candidatus Woesearchaeota archaeon]|nr:hypothetical protein [Candidatus Woesearchaeota archaeon]